MTDTLDGYLARRRGMVTTLGKFLDPLADKLLIVTALIALIPAREIPVWMVIVIVGREIAITGLRGIAVSQEIVISASTLGKYKTVFEVASIFFLILDGSYFFHRFSSDWDGSSMDCIGDSRHLRSRLLQKIFKVHYRLNFFYSHLLSLFIFSLRPIDIPDLNLVIFKLSQSFLCQIWKGEGMRE